MIRAMLAALNLGSVALGVASGGLAATLMAFLAGGALTLLGVDGGADMGLVVGVLVGFIVAGYVSGMRAPHSARFHGQVSGLGLAAIVVLVARIGGSPAGTTTILWLALLAIVVSGLAAWHAGRRRSR
jgi:hypothetical protein